MKNILNQLFQQEYLNYQTARKALKTIATTTIDPVHISAFMTVFRMRAISTEELRGFRDALLELCIRPDLDLTDSIDLCGTGGDGKDTFNISTLSAVVVAGAGYPVTKHGNYGVSSICGSSNVLECLGYQFTNDSSQLQRQLDQHQLCFLHAPLFHPAMKVVAPVRRVLGLRTFFNLLGPLVNPLQPQRQLVGVANLEVLRLYHHLLQQSGRSFALVHSLDGYDEVSLTGKFKLITNESNQLLSAQAVAEQQYEASALHGGTTVEEAATIFMQVLQGKASVAQTEVVCANAGIAIQRFQTNKSLTDCIAEAKEALLSGRAYQNFRALLN